jgi:hypothetical protein
VVTRPTVVLVVGLVGLGIAIAVAWGWNALIVYAFFAGIAILILIGSLLGGGWLRDASAGRFDRRRS